MRNRWLKLRRKLNANYTFNDDWDEIIEMFRKRVESRYFKTIREIIQLRYFEGEGFPIVALQCSLIETFAAFRKGFIHNPRYKENVDASYQYSDSRSLFVNFLLECGHFENNFFHIGEDGKKVKNKPFDAEKFYSNVRSPLIHETRTKRQWKIKVRTHCENKIFIEKIGNDYVLYRTVFQEQIEAYFNDYLDELKSVQNNDLRRLFARKLDHLLEFRTKKNYEWWLDK